jgi:hypothetical protein
VRIGTDSGIAIEDVDIVASVEVINSTLAVDFKGVLIHLDVDGAPPDVVFGGFLVYYALVLGGTTSLLAREVDEGTRGRDDGTFVSDGIFVELSHRSIALNLNAIHVEAGLGEVFEIPADEVGVLLGLCSLGIVLVKDVRGNVGGVVRGNHFEMRAKKQASLS